MDELALKTQSRSVSVVPDSREQGTVSLGRGGSDTIRGRRDLPEEEMLRLSPHSLGCSLLYPGHQPPAEPTVSESAG